MSKNKDNQTVAEVETSETESATVAPVETLTLGKLRPIHSAQFNALAASILSRFCQTDYEGKFILPTGPKERKILAALVSDGVSNPYIAKALVSILADKGLRGFLSPYTDRKGLFASEKALIEYLVAESDRAEVSEFPSVKVGIIG